MGTCFLQVERIVAMAQEGFLERLYQGHLDTKVFHGFQPILEFDKVQAVLEKYKKVLEEYPPRTIEEKGQIPKEMLQRMGEAGLFGVSIPELYGGLGFNLFEYMALIEEVVRLDLSVGLVSLAHLSIGCKGVQLFGNEAQKQKYLVPAASGDMIFSYALTEPLVGSDARNIQTRVELSSDGTHYILNGQKTYITNANYAGALTVFAQMDPQRPGFMGAFIVETGWEGVRIGKDMPKMGLKASSTAAIHFKDVRIPVENLLGQPGDGFKIAMIILNYGRLGLGAASVGMVRQSLEDMIKRSSSRIQFGVPIKNFPLVQEKMVKARVYSFVNSAMNDFTAGLLQENPTAGVALEGSHCKLFGTTRGWEIVYEALQVAGGSGYLKTQPYEKRMRDFRVTTVFEGTTEIHSIYPALFLLRKAAGQMKKAGGNRISEASFLVKEAFRRVEWPLKFENRIMARALKLAKANTATIRRMVFLGLLFHGRKIFEKEFLLRRISTLSLYTFGILAVLSSMAADRREGATESSRQEHLNLLHYFLEEAKEVRCKNKGLLDSRKEGIHGRIFKDLFRSAAFKNVSAPEGS